MTKQASIQYISSLINDPATITDGDQSSIALFRQTYPYFVPARYLLALESHKKSAWSPTMLSAIQPYTGNWLLLCDFLTAGVSEAKVNNEQEEIKVDEQEPANIAIPEAISQTPVPEPQVTEMPAEEHIPALPEEYTFIPATQDNPFFTQIIEEEPAIPAEAAIDSEPVVIAGINDEIVSVEAASDTKEEEPLILPIQSQDYFLHQGERVSEDIPAESELKVITGDLIHNGATNDYTAEEEEEGKSLMVMMSFSEWLSHFKKVSEKQKEETKDKKALKTMWQKEKLAAAMEEENEEIPENVFEMAVNSITNEDGLVSETLANIYIKQGKYDKAIEMYRKLSLRNPQKNVYFARKIDEILKDKQS